MIDLSELEKLYALFLNSSGITTDTRNIITGNIFFALKGEKFNANLFADQAFEKGASYVVVDEIAEPTCMEKFSDKLIVVHDALKVLQQLAGFHRKQFHCPVLAITGSNGKTIVKEWLNFLLSPDFQTAISRQFDSFFRFGLCIVL